jgi:hypothetical protein
MIHSAKTGFAAVLLAASLMLPFAALAQSQEVIEKGATGIGLTVGNLVVVPAKAVSIFFGALSGGLAFVFTGGDREVANQVWRDTSGGPYYITPELAKKAVGDRPLLSEKKAGGMPSSSSGADTPPSSN